MKKLYFYADKPKTNRLFCDWCIDGLELSDIYYPKYNDVNFSKTSKYLVNYQKNFDNEVLRILNIIHKSNYNLRHWKILLGRWSKYFLQSIYFRVHYLDTVVKKNRISELHFCFNEKKIFKPNTPLEMIKMLNNEEFNNYLLYKISLLIFEKKKIKIFVRNKKNIIEFQYPKFAFHLKQIFLNKVNFFLKFLIPKNSPVIVNTYFPRLEEFKMIFKFKSFLLWNNFFYNKNNELVNKLKKIHINSNRNQVCINKMYNKKFDKVINYFFFKLIPQCYLEHYNFCKNFVSKNFFLKPNFIFSSNNFVYDEFFKILLTENILKIGTKYFAGQHGSAYGLFKDQENTVEEQTSDKFLTWGWKYKKNHFPTFLFKTYKKKKRYNLNKIKKILIVTEHFPLQINFYNSKLLFLDHLNKSVNLINKFKANKNLSFEFKIHDLDEKNKEFYVKYFKKNLYNNNFSFTFSKKNIIDSLEDNSLVIFSYFSTGFLEFLSLNIPCLCFSNYNYDMFDGRSLKYLKLLEENKYLYFNENDIFKQIKFLEKVNDVNVFFKQKNKKISKFKKKYSNNEIFKIDNIFRLFNKKKIPVK